jgi:hypothetical protein
MILANREETPSCLTGGQDPPHVMQGLLPQIIKNEIFFSKGMNNNDILGFSLSPYNPATSIHIPKKNIFFKKESNIGNGTNWLLQFPIFNGRALRIEHTTFSTNFW